MICAFCQSDKINVKLKHENLYQKCDKCGTNTIITDIYNKSIQNLKRKRDFYVPFGVDSFMHYQSKL